MAYIFKLIKIFLIVIIVSGQIVALASYKSKIKARVKLKTDLPAHKDLQIYFDSLQRIVIFFVNYKQYLTLNIIFGLFLVNVHLRPFIKRDTLPVSVRNDLEYLLIHVDECLEEQNSKKYTENPKHNLSIVFTNDSVWTQRLPKFHVHSPKKAVPDLLPEWNTYRSAVDDFDNGIPNPNLSNKCMNALGQNEENISNNPLRCKLPNECREILIFGTKLGYGLTHRLLLLLEARLGQGCFIFSRSMDELMRNRFCELIYAEAEYIARNGFKNIDLIFEQIALCSLEGHANFLRKSWLSRLIQYQTEWGCFDIVLPSVSNKPFLENLPHIDDTGLCSGHFTAVTAAALAPAIRLILENYI